MHTRLFALFLAILLSSFAADGSRFDAAAATNRLGIDLFRRLAEKEVAGNLVISPLSIESVLAMAYVGADGATRAEMARALHLPGDDAQVVAGFGALRAALDAAATVSMTEAAQIRKWEGRSDVIEWRLANRLFVEREFSLREDFVAHMRDGFSAPLGVVDFKTAAEPARRTMNTWVAEQTKNRIQELIAPGAVHAQTRLVLVNALYLKAPWAKMFERQATRDEAFHLSGGTSVAVPTMRQGLNLRTLVDEGVTLLALNYLGGELQFRVMLPPAGKSIHTLITQLSPERLARWSQLLSGNEMSYVAVHLPKFVVKGAGLQLSEALRSLGVNAAFGASPHGANFDRIAPRASQDYFALSEVVHRTFIAVDEEGTEAAAATAVMMVGGAMRPKPMEIRIDRPFLFAIQHRATGVCLFLGRICDPR